MRPAEIYKSHDSSDQVLLVIEPQLVRRTYTYCLTGPFSICAGFIYPLFALNIKISCFGGPAKKEIKWSC